jgi:hypothetical protein
MLLLDRIADQNRNWQLAVSRLLFTNPAWREAARSSQAMHGEKNSAGGASSNR